MNSEEKSSCPSHASALESKVEAASTTENFLQAPKRLEERSANITIA